MVKFTFRKLRKGDEKQVMEYRQEFLKENDVIKGTKHLERYDNFQDYCNNLRVAKTGEPEMSQYLYIRKSDNKLVGMAIIRHELKESNENIGGHIGLGIRPSERGQGYGDLMLKQAIKVCSKMGIKTILMTCNKKNLPSIKNIKKNGGEYDGDIKSADGKITERYWIDLKGEEMKKLVLKLPTLKDKEDFLSYVKEFKEVNPSSNPLDFRIGDNYEEWLKKKENERKGRNLEEGRVPSTVYFLKYDGEDRILGHLSIRHNIDNEFLSAVGGHIGYGTRPSERRKGYGTVALKLALKECEKLGIKNALVTCKRENNPSARCIENNGGVLRDIFNFNGEEFNRYDFDLDIGEEKMKKVDTNLFKVLKERGLLYQCTDEEALKKVLESGKPIALYEGTDPTVDSLHIGHCVPYCILRRFQQAGHKVVLLMGGATASIGDPTGKSEMRKVLDKETIDKNIENIKNSLKVFLNFDGDNPAIIVNNKDWFTGYDYVDFMREIGRHFNVNKMLSNEIYANRIKEGGLTLFELGYMPMQAYDFIHLNKEHNCTLEWGGADQWGNIVAGVELARKLNFENGTNINLIGATNPLLLTPEGKKMGKTEKGAIWIDKDKISAYDFYQGVYQTPDACVEMMFALFTDIPMDEIKAMIKEDIVKAKKRLSYELTKFVRGEEDAKIAEKASEALFSGSGNLDNVPTCHISLPMNLTDALFESKLVSSKSEGRRMCQQGAISINGRVEKDFAYKITENDFENGVCILKKGKKNFMKLEI